jgi:hypothetical protein
MAAEEEDVMEQQLRESMQEDSSQSFENPWKRAEVIAKLKTLNCGDIISDIPPENYKKNAVEIILHVLDSTLKDQLFTEKEIRGIVTCHVLTLYYLGDKLAPGEAGEAGELAIRGDRIWQRGRYYLISPQDRLSVVQRMRPPPAKKKGGRKTKNKNRKRNSQRRKRSQRR